MARIAKLPTERAKIVVRKRSPRLRPGDDLAGLMRWTGPEEFTVEINGRLPEAEQEFTKTHELVHARRQLSKEDGRNPLEEMVVDLETLARVPREVLGRFFHFELLYLMQDYLTNKRKDNPNTLVGLSRIHKRINRVTKLLGLT